MRLPDIHLRRADVNVGVVSQRRARPDHATRELHEPGFSSPYPRRSEADVIIHPRGTHKIRTSDLRARGHIERSRRETIRREAQKIHYEVEEIPQTQARPAMQPSRTASYMYSSSRGPLVLQDLSDTDEVDIFARYMENAKPSGNDSNHRSSVPERRGMPPTTLPHRLRSGFVCQTVSRDETVSEDAKISFFVKMAMEPHVRKAQMGGLSRLDTSSFVPTRKPSPTSSGNVEYFPPYQTSWPKQYSR